MIITFIVCNVSFIYVHMCITKLFRRLNTRKSIKINKTILCSMLKSLKNYLTNMLS